MRLSIPLLLLGLGLTDAGAQEAKASRWEPKGLGVSLEVPAGWKVATVEGAEVLTGEGVEVTVSSVLLPRDWTIAELEAKAREATPPPGTSTRKVDDRDVLDETRTREAQATFMRRRSRVTVRASGPAERKPRIEAVMKSLRISEPETRGEWRETDLGDGWLVDLPGAPSHEQKQLPAPGGTMDVWRFADEELATYTALTSPMHPRASNARNEFVGGNFKGLLNGFAGRGWEVVKQESTLHDLGDHSIMEGVVHHRQPDGTEGVWRVYIAASAKRSVTLIFQTASPEPTGPELARFFGSLRRR